MRNTVIIILTDEVGRHQKILHSNMGEHTEPLQEIIWIIDMDLEQEEIRIPTPHTLTVVLIVKKSHPSRKGKLIDF